MNFNEFFKRLTFLYSSHLSGGSSSVELLLISVWGGSNLVGEVTQAQGIGGGWQNNHVHSVDPLECALSGWSAGSLSQMEKLLHTESNVNRLLTSNLLCAETSNGSERKH